ELAHALFIAVWAQTNNVFHDRIVFLSATPDTTTASLLDALFDPKQVGYDPPAGRAVVQSTQASKQVTMHVCSNEGDVIQTALDRTIDLLPRLRQLHQYRQSDEDVPLVVIFNSVVAAMVFEDLLAEILGSRDDIGVVRGLMSRRYRQFRGKMVVIGTSAIEVGIDFKSRYLIFEASNAGSFLQRLGRVGRHTSGTVYLLRYPEATTGLPSKPLDRVALQRLARTLYPAALTYAWFPQTDMGLLVAALIAFKGLQQQYTQRERVYLKSALDGLLDFVRGYAQRIHAEHGLPFVTRALRALANAQPRKRTTWLNDIADAITFRGSGLSLLVYDVIEPGRRGEPDAAWYDVAALDILTRAIAPSLQEKPGTGEPFVRVVGYGKLGDVDVRIAAPINKDALYGILLDSSKLATFDIIRDGQLSQIGRWALDAAGIGLLVRQQDWNRLTDSWLDWTIRGIRLAGENQGVMVLGAQALLVYALMKQHGLL
ncbi:MAG: hypothetical protein GY832_14340, partial [Chloroflexi bacterium]|nr:hypothetical protein [Chloroflexota bacterium]